MKNFLLQSASISLLVLFFIAESVAQESPASTAKNTVDGVTIQIDYHAPKVKGRIIWGGLEQYDKVWRTGADAATTIEVSEDVTIDGHLVPKGKYALFTIPKKGETWTVIINKVADQWGAFNYSQAEDLVRFEVPIKRTVELNESLRFDIKDDGTVVFAWEYRTFEFKVKKQGK
jgi:hypothetical protein